MYYKTRGGGDILNLSAFKGVYYILKMNWVKSISSGISRWLQITR